MKNAGRVRRTPDTDGKGVTVTIATRGLFTAHKPGCAHLHMAGDDTFDITVSNPSRSAVRAELDADGFEDSDLAYAPCLSDLPETS